MKLTAAAATAILAFCANAAPLQKSTLLTADGVIYFSEPETGNKPTHGENVAVKQPLRVIPDSGVVFDTSPERPSQKLSPAYQSSPEAAAHPVKVNSNGEVFTSSPESASNKPHAAHPVKVNTNGEVFTSSPKSDSNQRTQPHALKVDENGEVFTSDSTISLDLDSILSQTPSAGPTSVPSITKPVQHLLATSSTQPSAAVKSSASNMSQVLNVYKHQIAEFAAVAEESLEPYVLNMTVGDALNRLRKIAVDTNAPHPAILKRDSAAKTKDKPLSDKEKAEVEELMDLQERINEFRLRAQGGLSESVLNMMVGDLISMAKTERVPTRNSSVQTVVVWGQAVALSGDLLDMLRDFNLSPFYIPQDTNSKSSIGNTLKSDGGHWIKNLPATSAGHPDLTPEAFKIFSPLQVAEDGQVVNLTSKVSRPTSTQTLSILSAPTATDTLARLKESSKSLKLFRLFGSKSYLPSQTSSRGETSSTAYQSHQTSASGNPKPSSMKPWTMRPTFPSPPIWTAQPSEPAHPSGKPSGPSYSSPTGHSSKPSYTKIGRILGSLSSNSAAAASTKATQHPSSAHPSTSSQTTESQPTSTDTPSTSTRSSTPVQTGNSLQLTKQQTAAQTGYSTQSTASQTTSQTFTVETSSKPTEPTSKTSTRSTEHPTTTSSQGGEPTYIHLPPHVTDVPIQRPSDIFDLFGSEYGNDDEGYVDHNQPVDHHGNHNSIFDPFLGWYHGNRQPSRGPSSYSPLNGQPSRGQRIPNGRLASPPNHAETSEPSRGNQEPNNGPSDTWYYNDEEHYRRPYAPGYDNVAFDPRYGFEDPYENRKLHHSNYKVKEHKSPHHEKFDYSSREHYHKKPSSPSSPSTTSSKPTPNQPSAEYEYSPEEIWNPRIDVDYEASNRKLHHSNYKVKQHQGPHHDNFDYSVREHFKKGPKVAEKEKVKEKVKEKEKVKTVTKTSTAQATATAVVLNPFVRPYPRPQTYQGRDY